MLYNELKKLYYANMNVQFKLVFHTSLLNFPKDMLNCIAGEIPYQWIFPANVFYELELLKKSKLFGGKAEYVLALDKNKKAFQQNGKPVVFSNIEDFYDQQGSLTGLAASQNEKFIFIFGSQLKLMEFLTYVPNNENYFVFFHNRWSHNKATSEDAIVKVENAKKWIPLMDCERYTKNVVAATREFRKINRDKQIILKNIQGEVIGKYHISNNIGGGGEANIFTTADNSNILLKIFKEKLSRNHLSKIINLIKFSEVNHLEHYMANVIFPQNLLYEGDEPIGISLRKVNGCSLREMVIDPEMKFDLVEMIHDLAVTILELNLCHMLVADLDMDNLMLNSHGKVCLIDTDSFQYMHYGSGILIRPDYRHKELVYNNKNILYKPKHQDFSFSVLLFKMLVCGTGSPLYQVGASEASEKNQLFWGCGFDFPYKEYPYGTIKVPEEYFENWKGLPEILQRAFLDVFHFRRTFSIGHMVHVFDEAL